MTRPDLRQPKHDLYEDLMAISCIESSINAMSRRKTRVINDYTRLQRFIPNLKV